MCSHFPSRVFVVLALILPLVGCAAENAEPLVWDKHYIDPPRQMRIPPSETALRVCADPNNLPFTNSKGEGFENKIAELIGADMHRPVEYTWWAARRGFFRNTLKAGKCDVVMGVPDDFELVDATKPYYRSTYVFVSRRDSGLDISSLDDPRLRTLRVGVQLIGDDGDNAPAAHALAKRGIIDNVHGYTVYGDYTEDNPPARIIDAVVNKDVDVAVVWGPLAGYFSARQTVPLNLRIVEPELDPPDLPFAYDISIGVRPHEDAFKNKLDEILAKRRSDIGKILDAYHVPRPANAQKEVE